MLRWFALLFALAAFAAEANPLQRSETLRQYTAETSTDAGTIVAALKQRLPKSVALAEYDDGAMVHYAGNRTPAVLADFLTTGFEQLDGAAIAMGKTVSLTLTITDLGDSAEMSLMVLARFPAPAVPVMKGSHVIMDGTTPGACQGHMVIQHAEPIEDAAPAYREHLEDQGFAFEEFDPQDTSFFIGHRPGCDLALYLQEDRGTSLIVIRYLED